MVIICHSFFVIVLYFSLIPCFFPLDNIKKFRYNFVIKEVLPMPVIKSSADLRNNYSEISKLGKLFQILNMYVYYSSISLLIFYAFS